MEISRLMLVVGGIADRKLLVRATSRRAFEEALDRGEIVRVSRGRYVVPTVHTGTELAHAVTGHVCLASAALAHGWKVKVVPARPQIAVPKDRRIPSTTRRLLAAHWIDLAPSDVEGVATNARKTLEMCGRRLPFDEALSVADSALREGFPRQTLLDLAESAAGPGSARLRRVARHADGRAANPFESTLRAIALDVPGLRVEPQVWIEGLLQLNARCDLVDVRRRLVLEADSFEWHGDRSALHQDARRYDLLVANGWIVLRFAWEDVMHDQAWVRSVLAATVRRTEPSAETRLRA